MQYIKIFFQKIILKFKKLLNNIEKISNKKQFEQKYTKYIKKLKATKNKKKILLITHDYTLTGAPLAVFNTAKYLNRNGYATLVIGFEGGNLIDEYKKENIDALVSKEFTSENKQFTKDLELFDFVFANSIFSFDIINTIYNKKPYLWRISEGSQYINDNSTKYNEVLQKVPNIYAVSNYTKNILSKYSKNVNLLIYGISDVSKYFLEQYDKQSKYKKLKICTIGWYCERKAQDLIISAYNQLDESISHKIEIYFMGGGFESIIDNFKNTNIHIVGEKLDDEKYSLLAKCDILFCPSLDDPNPQVTMEAMMLKKPCVVTEKVGQKEYITDNVDGFVVKSGSIKDLKQLMIKLVKNPEIIENMSDKAYELYKKHYVFENYINKVINIIERQHQ